MNITRGKKHQASTIAHLIMEAMNHECCKYFAGESHTLEDFHNLMTKLVEMQESQYSHLNCIVAEDDQGEVAGVCVSYDGGKLQSLRKAFIEGAKSHFNRDFSNIDDETSAGELYLDSLAVSPEHRRKGIATILLKASIEKARKLNLPAVGLLVDKGNPKAEKLYRDVGFVYVEDSQWGGHQMRHLQYKL